jgi:putative selenate reductase
VEVCPNRANYTFFVEPVDLRLPQLTCAEGSLTVSGETPFAVTQTRQILHVDDLCNECGNCSTFCVHQGQPYAEKPRLFFKESDFALEQENAFLIQGQTIRRRSGGQDLQLTVNEGALVYGTPQVRLGLTPAFGLQEMTLKAAFDGPLSLKEAAEMALVYRGVKASLPFLLVEAEIQ